MFILHTGAYRQLENTFINHLLEQKNGDPLADVLVLSPSAHLLTHLQTLLSKERPGFVNAHFLTFYALAERILAEGPVSEERVVTEPALFREIVFDFLEGRGEIPFISRGAFSRPGSPVAKGLPGAVAATLKDLQDSGARVVDCANVAREGHLGEAQEGAVPILELNVLLYDVLRKRGLRAGPDVIRRATERVPQSAWIRRQKAIFLYGFYDLTGLQLDFINALSSHPSARIYFPYEEKNPAYNYAEILLKDPAFTSKTSMIKPAPAARESGGESGWLPGLEDVRQDFAYSCSGTHDEVWLAAKKILEWADAGMPYARMSLQARTLDPYLNTLREVFEAHRIPYALHAEEPVGAYPLVKTARQILRGDKDLDESPYLLNSPSDAETVDQTRPSALPGGINASWSEHVAWATALLSAMIKLPRDAGALEKRLWDGLLKALTGLNELDTLARPISRQRFLDVLEEKLKSLRLPLASDNLSGVQIMDVMTARGLSFDAVLLLGLNEKFFPRLIREDPFLSDSARSSLSQALGSRLSRKMDGYQEERLLFHLATTSARSRLLLSCQRSDEEGKALVISLYLHDYLGKKGLELKRLPRSWIDKIREVPAATLMPKELSLALHRENREFDDFYRALGWNRELIAHLLKSQSEIEGFGTLGLHDGIIGKDHPLTRELLAKGVSPHTLKDLAECPFKVYGRKILSLDPDEKDVEAGEVAASARGKIIHEILEAFYRQFAANPTLWKTPVPWEAHLDKIAETVFENFEQENPDLYPLAWQAEQNAVLTTLKRFVPLDLAEMQDSGFKPVYFELALEASAPATLQGRIDRIDLRQGPNPAFRVIDYKTGSAGVGKREKIETAILKGKSFQLPIYLLLAQAWLQKQGSPVANEGTALFYRLEEDDPLEAPLNIGSKFWKESGNDFYKNLSFLIKAVDQGSFYIRPSEARGYCAWCAFASLCRKEHKPTQIRSEKSPLRRQHEETLTLPKI